MRLQICREITQIRKVNDYLIVGIKGMYIEGCTITQSPTFSSRIFAFDLGTSLSTIDLASDELQIYFGRVAVRGILQYQL